MSLLELIIASSLMLVLVGATYFALSAGLSYQRRNDALMDMEQSGMNALTYLTRKLAEANYETVEVQAPPDAAITYSSYRDLNGSIRYDSNGRQLWDSVICFRIKNENSILRLVEQTEEVGGTHLDPLRPSALSTPRTPSYYASSSIPARVLANNIETLSAQTAPSGGPKALTLTLQFAITANNRKYGLKLAGKVHPRN